ncbi:hypothetical protein TNCV_2378371 [Trichonephila clavipes]|nr:hypothetical protein TNCV_2378371 [Trichonephila clavipes]
MCRSVPSPKEISAVTSLLKTSTSSRLSLWTRHPHVHLAGAMQPLFDPPRNLARRPEDEGRDALNLHGSGNQRILLSRNSGL